MKKKLQRIAIEEQNSLSDSFFDYQSLANDGFDLTNCQKYFFPKKGPKD